MLKKTHLIILVLVVIGILFLFSHRGQSAEGFSNYRSLYPRRWRSYADAYYYDGSSDYNDASYGWGGWPGNGFGYDNSYRNSYGSFDGRRGGDSDRGGSEREGGEHEGGSHGGGGHR